MGNKLGHIVSQETRIKIRDTLRKRLGIRDEDLIKLHKGGVTPMQMTEIYNCHLSVIHRRLNKISIYVPRNKKEFNRPDRISRELAYVLGAMYGDGCLKSKGKIKLEVTDLDFAVYFKECLEKCTGLECAPIKKIKVNKRGMNRKDYSYLVVLYSIEVWKFIKSINPNELLNTENEVKAMFIKGFADAEGNVALFKKSTRNITLHNKDMELLELCKKILNKLCVSSTIGQGHNALKLAIYGQTNLTNFNNLIGFSISRKRNILSNLLNSYTHQVYEPKFKQSSSSPQQDLSFQNGGRVYVQA